jgi:D-alanyl-D-alanine dipeptidase
MRVRAPAIAVLGASAWALASAARAAPAELVDIARSAPDVRVELKYATKDNFLKRAVYGDDRRCLLRPDAARMLARADALLRRAYGELRLLVYDCARPLRVQRLMWQLVRGTPAQPYVADPAKGSLHNVGCAVDLTLADARGTALDMGSAFDSSGPLSQPRREREARLAGRLGQAQWARRLLLRQVMVEAGFVPLDIEWWHFDCARPKAARQR